MNIKRKPYSIRLLLGLFRVIKLANTYIIYANTYILKILKIKENVYIV